MDRITVKMVCQRAGISRQALYNHYYSLTAVLADALERELSEALNGCAAGRDWADCLGMTLQCFRDKRKALLNVYRSSYRRELMDILERGMLRGIRQEVTRAVRENGLTVAEEDQEFAARAYLAAVRGLLEQYFSTGMELEPAYVVSRSEAFLRGTLPAGLRRLAGEEQKEGEVHG